MRRAVRYSSEMCWLFVGVLALAARHGARAGTVRELFDRSQLNELNGRRVL